MRNLVALAAFALFAANRGLLAVAEYHALVQERATDHYMKSVCDRVDYRQIGRHALLCADLERRLNSHVLVHVARNVLDDTVNVELSAVHALAMLGAAAVIAASSAAYARLRVTETAALPTHKLHHM